MVNKREERLRLNELGGCELSITVDEYNLLGK